MTGRQRETLLVALRGALRGPPGVHPAEVADAPGVDESATGETNRRSTQRVLEWFLLEAR